MISDAYRELNRELLRTNPKFGNGGARWADEVVNICKQYGYCTVLDYGCGKGFLKKALRGSGLRAREYDPAVPGKDAPPEPADLVVCADVLEHVEPEHLKAVLAELRRLAKKRCLFVIASVPSTKLLSDGRNTHLIVEDEDWWFPRLYQHFDFKRHQQLTGKFLLEVTPCPPNVKRYVPTPVASSETFCRHVRLNVLRGLPELPMFPAHDKVMVLACYGPSLVDTWPEIAKMKGDGVHEIFTVSGAHDFLISKGVIPDAHVEVETREHKATLITPHREVQYLLASCVHPALFAKLAGHDVWLWHTLGTTKENAEMRRRSTAGWLGTGGSVVGLRAVSLGHALGYRRPAEIHGMDCSYREEAQHAGPHPRPETMMFKLENEFGTWITSGQLLVAAREFLRIVETDFSCRLHGDGLLQAMTKHLGIVRVTHGPSCSERAA